MFVIFQPKRRFLKEASLTLGSLAALAAINYTIIHNSFIFIVLLVLVAHELGHYFVAAKNNADPRLPIFFPLPFILIAATRVRKMNRSITRKIALAGPVAGALTAGFLAIIAWILGLSPALLGSLLILLASEILFNFFGADGRRFRRA